MGRPGRSSQAPASRRQADSAPRDALESRRLGCGRNAGAVTGRFPHGEPLRMTASTPSVSPDVAIIMGSRSDWPTMRLAADRLDQLGVAWEARVVSAHRTPQRLYDFATRAKANGVK